MERYNINGFEVEYDTFDLENIEARERAGVKVQEAIDSAKDLTGVAQIRMICSAVLDYFDEVLGEGSSAEIFGGRVNFLVLITSFRIFTSDISEAVRTACESIAPAVPADKSDNAHGRISNVIRKVQQ